MGCSGGCGGARAKASEQYPREVTMPDGSKKTVTSAAQERVERSRIQAQMREASRKQGYRVQRG
jgi:hypothetical protein